MGKHTVGGPDDHTQNFWVGCQPVSEGCMHCYARTAMQKYDRKFDQVTRTKTWKDPLSWQREAAKANRVDLVFTCSWSDFFHPTADPWRPEAWAIIKNTPNLIWSVLTKRADLIADRLPHDWGNGYPNVWLGVTVEMKKYLGRMDTLRTIPAAVRYVITEPLLEDLMPDIEQHLQGFHWFTCGGESGEGHRPMNLQWARKLRDLCKKLGIPFYFKQISARWPQTGKLDGIKQHEYPAHWAAYRPAVPIGIPGQIPVLDPDFLPPPVHRIPGRRIA